MPPRPEHAALDVVAYRVTSYDSPFWVNPNRRDGRWNIAGQGVVQYLALDPEAPWAEQLRGQDLGTEHDAAMFRAALWLIRIYEQQLADYGSFEKAEAAGFPADALVDDDWEQCQNEARRLQSLGYRGVLAPSAALPGSQSLTLFGPRVPVAWTTQVRTASMLPVQATASGGPPPGLVARVRYFGQTHAGLAEYRARQEG
jgi:RES domain